MDLAPKVNILAADDRRENLLASEVILDASSYHLVKAHSGDEALKYLFFKDFADVQMPGHPLLLRFR